ncbi:MAG TPA: hypothetical protein VFT79_08085 [Solirubrobacterales bacterium]|nr:hypothetical protein [Solirubrobacterales bacterium]
MNGNERGSDEARARFFSKVRTIRADAKALLVQLKQLEEAAKNQDGSRPDSNLTKELQRADRALSQKKLDERLREVEKIEADFPHLEIYGDCFGEVRNAVRQVSADWPKMGSADLTAITKGIERSSKALQEVVLGCYRLTIPKDVERSLGDLSIGKSLDFDLKYKEEIPDEKVREEILAALSQRRIGGWVDLKAGLIYRVSPQRSVRVLTYLAPLLAVAAAVLLLIGIANLKHLGIDLPGTHLDDAKALVGAFLLVLGGAVIHLVVENVKQFQMDAAPIVAISNLLDWMHLRWAGISLMAVPLVVVTIGMRMAVDSTPDQVATYILAGYSADSIAGVFLTRFDSSASASAKKLIKRLKGEDGSAGGKDGNSQ